MRRLRLLAIPLFLLLLMLLPSAPRVLAQTVIVSDGFNRADGAIGNADVGGAWSVISGSPAIVSNELVMPNPAWAIIDPAVSDYTACVTYITTPTNAVLYVHSTSSVPGVGVRADFALSNWVIIDSAVGVIDSGVAYAAGDVVCFVVTGSDYELFIDGVLALTHNTSTYTDTGVSLRKSANSQVIFDDFSVTVVDAATPTPTETPTPSETPTPTEVIVTVTPSPTPTPDPSIALQERTDQMFSLQIFGFTIMIGLGIYIFLRLR